MVIDLAVGDRVEVKDWGIELNGRICTIKEIKPFGGCESGVMVKLDYIDIFIDSNYLNKIPSPSILIAQRV